MMASKKKEMQNLSSKKKKKYYRFGRKRKSDKNKYKKGQGFPAHKPTAIPTNRNRCHCQENKETHIHRSCATHMTHILREIC